MNLPGLRSFVKSVFHRSRVEQEMESELRFHLESRAADLEASGLSPSQAMRQARIEFGPVATHKDGMRRSLGLRLIDELCGDLRYAARILRRSPGFTAVAVGSLALGIGANTIIFTLAKGVLLDRLAVPKPQELRLFSTLMGKRSPVHSMWGNFGPAPNGTMRGASFSYPVYQLLKLQNHANPVMGELFAFKDLGDGRRMTVSVDGHPDVVTAQMVSGNFYEQLGIRAALGRSIQAADDAAPGAGAVVVLSDGLWSRMFGRSPASAFGALALTLACIGIYGIMAYNVARRTNEIGLRMALGARSAQVLGMVLRESVWMAAIGIAVGLAGAYGLTRFVSAMLFGLKPMVFATLAGAAAVLFGVALAAGFGPARRASRIDPMVALRHE